MAGDLIKVNAGGRWFETTRATLVTSGSGYFQALLGPTGQALGRGVGSEAEDVAGRSVSNGISGRGTKRARCEEDDDQSDEAELFVDRSPDLFSDVLDFMRSGRLLSKTKTDLSRLEDLRAEAEFFAYDELQSAVDEASEKLRAAVAEVFKPEPEPEASFHTMVLANEEEDSIAVPKGKVLYLVSATLAGDCRVFRYTKGRHDKSDNITGCYIECDQRTSGDFQLIANIDGDNTVLAHVGLNHIHTCTESGLDVDFRQNLGICLSGGDDEEVTLVGQGSAEWHILYWVGDADAIPGIRSPEHNANRAKRMRRSRGSASDGASGGSSGAAGVMAAAAAALAVSSANTSLAMMMALSAMSSRR